MRLSLTALRARWKRLGQRLGALPATAVIILLIGPATAVTCSGVPEDV